MSQSHNSGYGPGRSSVGTGLGAMAISMNTGYAGPCLQRAALSPHVTHGYGGSSLDMAGRHGSGAQYRPRQSSPGRSADRADRQESRQSYVPPGHSVIRITTAGSQEAADWSDALDRVANEMGTLQRNAHTMAVQLAEAEGRINCLNNRCADMESAGTTTTANITETYGYIVNRYMPRKNRFEV